MPRILKFGTNIGYDNLYRVLKNQPHIAYQSLYLSIFFFFSKYFVSYIKESATYCLSVPLFVHFYFFPIFSHHISSASMSARVFKFCIHDEDDQVYY